MYISQGFKRKEGLILVLLVLGREWTPNGQNMFIPFLRLRIKDSRTLLALKPYV